jgi:hypothetical protein
MKFLISLFFATVTLAGYAAPANNITGPYEVTATGKTVEEAKQLCFRQAIERAIGVAVVSEVQVDDRSTVSKNTILKHSAGYVEKFKIIESIEETNSKVTITMVVYVKPSMLNDYVLHAGKSNKSIEGEQIGEKISSYISEREQGDKFLTSVLRDYPNKAFVVTQGKFEVKANDQRKMALMLEYSIKFNNDYLVALAGALNQVHDAECRVMCSDVPSFTVIYRSDKEIIGNKKTYYFNETVKPNNVFSVLTATRGLHEPSNPVMVRADLTDFNGKVLLRYCVQPDYIPAYKRGISYGVDGGSWKESGTMMIELDQTLRDTLPKVDKIQVSAVQPSACKI